jgi:hypothetical protein
MEVRTMTSVYELTKDKWGMWLLKKIAIIDGHTSTISIGQSFTSKTVEIRSGCLCLGEFMHTSPVKNLTEVEQFIK